MFLDDISLEVGSSATGWRELGVFYFSSERAMVELTIYDVQGRLVRTLASRWFEPGRRFIHWDGRDNRGNPVASGIYVYRLVTPGFTDSKKMVLLR